MPTRDDDDFPRRRPRRRFDEDDDDRGDLPSKARWKRREVKPLIYTGIGVGVLILLLACGGVAYLVVSGAHSYTITRAGRVPSPGGGTDSISIEWRTTRTDLDPAAAFFIVVKAGGRTQSFPVNGGPTAGGRGAMSTSTPLLAEAVGPVEVWFEKQPAAGGEGRIVSNVYPVR